MIEITAGALPGLLTYAPIVREDARGFFFESYNERAFREATGLVPRFVQDNQSHSVRGVLRGLHYQVRRLQAKLVRVLHGEILDVAVDVRRGSPTLGRWEAVRLSGENRIVRWVPEGYAHGFLVLSEAPAFSTRRPNTGPRSSSAPSRGTTPRSPSSGRSTAPRSCPQKTRARRCCRTPS
jgi:dTDP-4-dehydrorhamnose 3,5-epimerase